jgi:trk system potassium uptake protein TrkA
MKPLNYFQTYIKCPLLRRQNILTTWIINLIGQIMRIIIVGGGRTGYHLAKHIPRSLIIEKNPEKYEKLNELIGVNAVLGDGSDEKVLLKAGLKEADAVITVTADDKTNYDVSEISKRYGVRNIISRMENPDNEVKFNELDISAILCPTTVVADYIKELIHPKSEKEFFIKKILVPIIAPETMDQAFEEALQIALKTDAELILVGNKQEVLGEEKKILSLLDVPASLEIEEGSMVEAIEKHVVNSDLVVVDPEEVSYFEKILKKSIILRLLEKFETPILVSRVFRPYKNVLLLADTSKALKEGFEMAWLFGDIFHSSVEVMMLEESLDLEEAVEKLKEQGKINGFNVVLSEFEGNVNIEVVKKVKSGKYDLTILPWGSPTLLKDDIGDKIIHDTPGSILTVKG